VGGFWTSLSLRATDQRRVADAVRRLGRVAYVSPAEAGWVAVFDEKCDEQDEGEIVATGKALTKELDTSGLAILVHDGDALWYWLFDRGELVDEYASWPGYFEGDEPKPEGGDPKRLCGTLGIECHPGDVTAVLHELHDHADALFLHESLARALNMPQEIVGLGYRHVETGDDEHDPAADAYRRSMIHVGKGEEKPRRAARKPGPRAVPPLPPPASRAQLLPFVKPGSAPEEELRALRSALMDEVADKLISDGGAGPFLEFLEERLATAGEGPASLRALQAQLPFLHALSRRSPDAALRRRVDALIEAVQAFT
jgi:hypothetical protein